MSEYRSDGVEASSAGLVGRRRFRANRTLSLMFTGLVQAIGRVSALEMREGVGRLRVNLGAWTHSPEQGASIAVNGCCLTVAEVRGSGDEISFDVIAQTLAVTTLGALARGDAVNLEHAATPTTFLGGHVVLGHIDARAEVVGVSTAGEWRVQVRVPSEYARFVVERGSIAFDGVSLTIARVQDATDGSGAVVIDVCLIPETLARTTLQQRVVGDAMNFEVDHMAKLIAALIARQLKP